MEKFILLLLLAIVPSSFTLYIHTDTIRTQIFSLTTTLHIPPTTTSITTSIQQVSSPKTPRTTSTIPPTTSPRKVSSPIITLKTSLQTIPFSTTTSAKNLYASTKTTSLTSSTKDLKIVATTPSDDFKISTFGGKESNSFEETLICYYNIFVDKTKFISEFISRNSQFQLITRPERFGKTFNMEMLAIFFDIAHDENGKINEKRQDLCRTYFEGGVVMQKSPYGFSIKHSLTPLAVSNDHTAMRYLRRHPVIHLSFAVMGSSYSVFRRRLIRQIAGIIDQKWYKNFLLPYCNHVKLPIGVFRDDCINLLQTPYETLLKTDDLLKSSVATLAALLEDHFQSSVVILVDEYDNPLNRMISNKTEFDATVTCIKELFTETFKLPSNTIFRGVVTGVLQLSSAEVSSGIKAALRCSIFEDRYSSCFGFTADEIQILLKKSQNCSLNMSDIINWYNGYLFSGNRMFNPQSIRRLMENCQFDRYWVLSSPLGDAKHSEDVHLKVLLQDEFQPLYQKLYTNHFMSYSLNSIVDFKTARDDEEQFLSILTVLGFTTSLQEQTRSHLIMIPNTELRELFQERIQSWALKQVNSSALGFTLRLIIAQMVYDFERANITAVHVGFADILTLIGPNVIDNQLCNVIFGLLLTQDHRWDINRTFYTSHSERILKKYCSITLSLKSGDYLDVIQFLVADINETPDKFKTMNGPSRMKFKISADVGRINKTIPIKLIVDNEEDVMLQWSKDACLNFRVGPAYKLVKTTIHCCIVVCRMIIKLIKYPWKVGRKLLQVPMLT